MPTSDQINIAGAKISDAAEQVLEVTKAYIEEGKAAVATKTTAVMNEAERLQSEDALQKDEIIESAKKTAEAGLEKVKTGLDAAVKATNEKIDQLEQSL